MPRSGWYYSVSRWMPLCALLLVLGCEPKNEPAVQNSPVRRANQVAAARLADQPPAHPAGDVPVRPAGPAETQPADRFEIVGMQVPDPLFLLEEVRAELARIPAEIERMAAELA
jgi:hypothetical protein